MNLDGTVVDLNPSRGLIAVKTEGHGFAIFEVLTGGELHAGDRVRWNDWRNELVNAATGDRTVVVLQNFGVGSAGLSAQLLKR